MQERGRSHVYLYTLICKSLNLRNNERKREGYARYRFSVKGHLTEEKRKKEKERREEKGRNEAKREAEREEERENNEYETKQHKKEKGRKRNEH